MVKQFLIFLLCIFPVYALAQVASFYADTTHFYRERTTRKDIYDQIMQTEWRINGQVLRYGSEPVEIKCDADQLDTIFYKQYRGSWDTLICNISRPGQYKFVYNDCCGAFYVADHTTGKFIEGKVRFRIKGKTDGKTYLGILGEAGILVTANADDTLVPGCRSAMSPNVYPVSFSEIEICKDTAGCYEGTCLYEKGATEPNYEFGYTTLSAKLNFLYLPLGNGVLDIVYDPKTGKANIK